MNTRAEIDGVEFDWFARDRAGRLAVFATAGTGPVPAVVVAASDEHSEVSEVIDTPHWGSERVWDDLASVGLYVFDWSSRDSYRRLRVPAGEMPDELRVALNQLKSIPELNVDFDQSIDVAAGELPHAT